LGRFVVEHEGFITIWSARVMGAAWKYRLLIALGCLWVCVHACSVEMAGNGEGSFDLARLGPISLDDMAVIPALTGWIICDYDVKNERLLAVNYKSMEIAISAKDSAWKPEVIRGFDGDKIRVWPLGFLSSRETAIVYYEDKREGFREEIDLKTKTVISSDKIIKGYNTSFFVGPNGLAADKERLAEDIFKEEGLGRVICFVRADLTKLLGLNADGKLFSLDLETERLRQIDQGVYSEGGGEFLPRWAGLEDLVTYFKRDKSSDVMELYVANTQGVSKRVYSTALGDKKSICFVSFFVASPIEGWGTLVGVKEQSFYTARFRLEYGDRYAEEEF
jgi:hypothetical protein